MAVTDDGSESPLTIDDWHNLYCQTDHYRRYVKTISVRFYETDNEGGFVEERITRITTEGEGASD